jgi:transposase
MAIVLFEKFGKHEPLNRQAKRHAKEGRADQPFDLGRHVGGCTIALTPCSCAWRPMLLSAERLQGDDTTMPVLVKG